MPPSDDFTGLFSWNGADVSPNPGTEFGSICFTVPEKRDLMLLHYSIRAEPSRP